MRLAHNRATNQLTDWRVVVAFDRGDQDEGADYYLVRLNGVYESGPAPGAARRIPRYLPGNVGVTKVRTPSGFIIYDHAADYWVEPWGSAPSPEPENPHHRVQLRRHHALRAERSQWLCLCHGRWQPAKPRIRLFRHLAGEE